MWRTLLRFCLFTIRNGIFFFVPVYLLQEYDGGTLVCVRSHTVCRVFINLFTIYLFSLQHAILETRSVHGQWLCFCVISVTSIKCFIGCFAASLDFASLLPQQVKFICCGLPCLVQGRLEFKASLIETLKSYRLPDLLFHEGISKT